MTPEDIDKLADEYADKECAMSRHTGKKLKQLHEDKIIEFYDVFGFLIERFCIVPKCEILADYEFNAGCFAQFSASGDDRCNKIAQWHKGKCDELESLFGKDIFENGKL